VSQKSPVMTLMEGMTPPVTMLKDDTLIRLAVAGEAECFSALMDRHLSVIRKRVRSRVQSQADSDDLVQEVVLKVWRRLSTFRWESSFRTWMTRIAINEVFQGYRRQQRLPVYRAPSDLAGVPSTADTPHQALARAEEIQTLYAALAELPKTYRRVLVLRDLQELSLLETAEQLESTVPAVKTRLFRARRMLLDVLKRSSAPRLARAA
jgi:RNA polymerase sigma-70 factor (ECF subfamily)